MNATIVTIGSSHFLFSSPAKGSKIVELLAGAIQVDYDYHAKDCRRMWRTVSHDERTPTGVSMQVVDASEIQKSLKRIPESRRLGHTPNLPDHIA